MGYMPPQGSPKAEAAGAEWHTIPRVDKTPSVTGSWVDVDVSDVVPEGAKAVAVLFTKYSDYCGVRKNGATDEGTRGTESPYSQSRLDIVELDENRIFEAYCAYSKMYIVGYLK